MNTISRATIIALVCLISARPVAAQRVSELRVGLQSIPATDSHGHVAVGAAFRESYWKEGALIGAIPSAIAAFFIFKDWGDSTRDGVVAGVMIGGVAAILGALIGGQFPKGGS
jgi:hypothetical protein